MFFFFDISTGHRRMYSRTDVSDRYKMLKTPELLGAPPPGPHANKCSASVTNKVSKYARLTVIKCLKSQSCWGLLPLDPTRMRGCLKQGSHLAELEPRVVASWRDLMASSFIIKTYFLISRILFLISRNRIPDITKSNS